MARERSIDAGARESLERSLRGLGCEVTRWRGRLASVRRGDERFHLSLDVVASLLDEPVASIGESELTLLVADLLGLPVEHSLLLDLSLVRPMLRPRLVNVRELEGPSRSMCRRELHGDLLTAVSVGSGSRRTFVTSRLLDAWSLEFGEVMLVARENLRGALDTSSVVDCQGADGLLAVAHEREPASASVLILEDLLPGVTASPGVVWSAPSDETLLLLPVEAGSGIESLSALIQATFAIAHEQSQPLSEQVFWRVDDSTWRLPLTWVEEGRARRVHLEAEEGVMAELLAVLGDP